MKYPDDYINRIICGDSKDILKLMPDNCVDAIVTDPPAAINFMGMEFDSDRGGRENWIAWLASIMSEALRVLKPGGHALVWSLPRTSHWTGTALEDAGFEVRDCVYHLFGSGFPKSLDISKAIDKQAGETPKIIGKRTDGRYGSKFQDGNNQFVNAENNQRLEVDSKIGLITEPSTPEAKQWEGWGTALKPAVECWWLCRKPLSEDTVAENVLKHGTAGLNIDGSRIPTNGEDLSIEREEQKLDTANQGWGFKSVSRDNKGRFPANLIHDGSDVILAEFAKAGESKGWASQKHNSFNPYGGNSLEESKTEREGFHEGYNDTSSPARFFYTAKPSSSEKNLLYGEFEEKYMDDGREIGSAGGSNPRNRGAETPRKNHHPTCKGQSLMQYLIKLITPPKGIVLDMFAGSGSTCLAAKTLGHPFIGIEIDEEYCKIANARLAQGVLDF